jgi:PrcB C-terminal
MLIPFTTIAQGISSGHQTADHLIIGTVEQWEQLWQEHTSDVILPPEVPQIDFSENLVIALFCGEKPTSGYTAEIVSVKAKAMPDSNLDHLIVRVHYGLPDSITQDVLTYPYHIIQLPQINTLRDTPGIFFEEA